MKQHSLSTGEWTQIVAAGGLDDVEILPLAGSCITSLNGPNEKGAHILAPPPLAMGGPAFTRRIVAAGIPVFAKAVDEVALVRIAPAQF